MLSVSLGAPLCACWRLLSLGRPKGVCSFPAEGVGNRDQTELMYWSRGHAEQCMAKSLRGRFLLPLQGADRGALLIFILSPTERGTLVLRWSEVLQRADHRPVGHAGKPLDYLLLRPRTRAIGSLVLKPDERSASDYLRISMPVSFNGHPVTRFDVDEPAPARCSAGGSVGMAHHRLTISGLTAGIKPAWCFLSPATHGAAPEYQLRGIGASGNFLQTANGRSNDRGPCLENQIKHRFDCEFF